MQGANLTDTACGPAFRNSRDLLVSTYGPYRGRCFCNFLFRRWDLCSSRTALADCGLTASKYRAAHEGVSIQMVIGLSANSALNHARIP